MTSQPETTRSRFGTALLVVGGLLAAMWALELVDQLTRNWLDQFGILPRRADSLPHILTAPWLHFGWGHLISNSVPFLVLGVINYLGGAVRWLISTLSSILFSGLLVWLISPSFSMTLGASGLVFGWLTYLIVRGFYTRHLADIAIGLGILLVYGGILWGVLPGTPGVSWQGHLGGAIGGIVAAWWLNHKLRDKRNFAQA